MNATPGKGIIITQDNALVKEEPGILSQVFIGFFWYFLVCGKLLPPVKYVRGKLWEIRIAIFWILILNALNWTFIGHREIKAGGGFIFATVICMELLSFEMVIGYLFHLKVWKEILLPACRELREIGRQELKRRQLDHD